MSIPLLATRSAFASVPAVGSRLAKPTAHGSSVEPGTVIRVDRYRFAVRWDSDPDVVQIAGWLPSASTSPTGA